MTNLWKTKTFWSGVASIVTAVGLITQGDYAQGASMIAMGLIAIFGRNAIVKVQNGRTDS